MYWTYFGEHITGQITSVFDFVIDVFSGAFEILTNVFGFFTSLFQGNWDDMWKYIVNALVAAVQLVLRGVDFLIGELLRMIDFGLNAIGVESNLLDGWQTMIGDAQSWLEGLKYEMQDTESAGESLWETLSGGFGIFGGGGGAAKPVIQKPSEKTTTTTNGDRLGIPNELMTGPTLMERLQLPPQSKFKTFFNAFRDELTNTNVFIEQMAASAQNMGESIGSAFAMMITGAEGGREAMKQALSNIVDTAFQAATAHAIQAATATGAASGPAAAFVSPALIASGMALVRGVFKGLTGFADGGIVYGPTAALVAEYSGARSNPEVIAPLNKLQSMLGGSSNVVVTGRISGNDILISNERARFDRGRVRGF